LPGKIGPGIRPTAARVREALFSVVGQDLTGWTVLDAYAGSGLLGFEAVSRGGEVTLVERDLRARGAMRDRAEALGVQAEWIPGATPKVLENRRWDLVLADPPYAAEPTGVLLGLAPHVGRLLVLEHATTVETPETVATSDSMAELVRDRVRTYGDTALSVYRVASSPHR
jgi:16S rRNA (guanine(966)-N(2))-methyltransferase RsmD